MSRVSYYCCLSALAALTGCGTLSLSALHDPLYRASAHLSTITASARDTDSGVAEIRIDVVEGELTACAGVGGLTPSLVPCRTNAVARSRICTFANVKAPVSCSFPLQLGDQRLITYTTSARSGSGKSASTGAITYAGGAPLTQTQILGILTIPWETARPVWWHTDTPAGGAAPADKIDVGFFPDADFAGNYQTFTDGIQPIVLGAYFNSTDQFANTYTLWKNLFNFWAGPDGADAQDCTRSFTGTAATIAGVTDGDVILHQNPFRDCASIALGGSGSTQTTLSDAAWVFTHESGHYLHGLGDEYVGGGNASVSDPPNIYASQAACQSAATPLSINSSFCAQIGTTGKWRMDDGNPTTMEDRVLNSDWRTASGVAINRRVSKCGGGACY
ncbi:MAG: hypothetical protein WBX11_09150 [Thiobacillaceae bacterium]